MPRQTATFAAGCFWGVESAFRGLLGVSRTAVGYTGGSADHPTYEQVCGGGTGHAEAVEVEYEADVISYSDLLEVFWGRARSDHSQPTGMGHREPVPLGNLHSQRSADRGRDRIA